MNEILKLKGNLQLISTLEDVKQLLKRDVRLSIPKEELEALESNELFSVATEEGFSVETLRQVYEPVLDYFLEKINWEKIKSCSAIQLLQIFHSKKDLDLEAINGAYLFNLALSEDSFKELLAPEAKKQDIFSRACELASLLSKRKTFLSTRQSKELLLKHSLKTSFLPKLKPQKNRLMFWYLCSILGLIFILRMRANWLHLSSYRKYSMAKESACRLYTKKANSIIGVGFLLLHFCAKKGRPHWHIFMKL